MDVNDIRGILQQLPCGSNKQLPPACTALRQAIVLGKNVPAGIMICRFPQRVP